MTSYMSCGRRTGCVDGQAPVVSKDPVVGYATWALWSGLSTFTPSQHLRDGLAAGKWCSWGGLRFAYVGNVMVVLIPPPHLPVGSEVVSDPVQGAPPNGFCSMLLKQRWQICFCCPSGTRRPGSPTSMRKPYTISVNQVSSFSAVSHYDRVKHSQA